MTRSSPQRAAGSGRELRVTLISTLPPHMGIADYTAQLAGGLAQTPSLSLEVIDFASLYPRWLYPGRTLRDATARQPDLPGVRVRTMLRWYNPLSWVLAGMTLQGQVVHAQWWSYVLAPVYLTTLLLARLRRRRVVLTVHNVAPHEGGRWRRLLNTLVFGLADAYIVHDERGRESLSHVVGEGKEIAVIPHGILESLHTAAAADAREELSIPEQAKVILNFGNVRPYKGIDVLLRAFARVLGQVPEAVLVIAGKLWEEWEPYQEEINRLGLGDAVRTRLDFIPASDVGTFFAAADVVVLPYTQFDAQSGVGARALYHGKPLVVTDAGGLPELVSDRRMVVPPGEDEALAEALVAVLTDDGLRGRLEEQARQRARELQWDAIAEKTVALYERLVSAQAVGSARSEPRRERQL